MRTNLESVGVRTTVRLSLVGDQLNNRSAQAPAFDLRICFEERQSIARGDDFAMMKLSRWLTVIADFWACSTKKSAYVTRGSLPSD